MNFIDNEASTASGSDDDDDLGVVDILAACPSHTFTIKPTTEFTTQSTTKSTTQFTTQSTTQPTTQSTTQTTIKSTPDDALPPPRNLADWDGGKVEWTDDSDTPSVRRKREKDKTGTTRRRGRKRRRRLHAPDTDGNDDTRAYGRHLDDDDTVPSVVRERRREFDDARRILGNAGLRLPPGGLDEDDHDVADVGVAATSLEERPWFDERSGVRPCRPHEPIGLRDSAGVVPASIAQYLRDYQVAGVRFLHRLFAFQRGGILGDDMGLGKTVQVAAFLAAAYGKSGTERDRGRMRRARCDSQRWYPTTLIICPGSLIQNWCNELARWGYWIVEVFHGAAKDDVIRTARAGRLEVMVTTYDTYKLNAGAVNTVRWDCVVADECHRVKDRASGTTRALEQVNALCRIGLTGTAIQNRYEELWTLLNWTNPGRFGTAAEWNRTISLPLRVGQSHDATLSQLSLARLTAKKLVRNLLPGFFLRRMKSLIADQLPHKADRVVFCPLTTLQRGAYERFLASEDVAAVRTAGEPCDCGSGRKRGWCCHQRLPDGRPWLTVVFPAMIVLQKLANHVALLAPPSTVATAAAAADPEKQAAELRHLRACFPDSWEQLYRERDRLVSLANVEFCGKWKVLRRLLRFWHGNGDKVLVFSHSVRLLRVLQHLFGSSTSYNVSFLDGSLSYEERQQVVDGFNSDPAQFVFLISTRAGGVGLNITSANKVVIMDPHWNPSYDLQAQDRAYRIGQTRDVDVFRLVSVGTIEEIVYARQVYKQQQANIGYTASSERRYFSGVQEDHGRTGEIFGLDNLFTFHGDQPVLRDIVNKTNVAEARVGVGMADLDAENTNGVDNETISIKQEDSPGHDDGGVGVGQLAALIVAENQELALEAIRAKQPRSDAVQAILTAAGVEYTHDNAEVVGTSRVEEQLSRRAELAAQSRPTTPGMEKKRGVRPEALGGVYESALFGEEGGSWEDDDYDDDDYNYDDDDEHNGRTYRYRFRPPEDVKRRQFCSMVREFGFGADVAGFALVVESWTQEQRREWLDKFYQRRAAMLGGRGGGGVKEGIKGGVKMEIQEDDIKEDDIKTDRYALVDIDAETDDQDDDNGIKVRAQEGISVKKEATIINTKEEDVKVGKESRDGGDGGPSGRLDGPVVVFASDDEDDDLDI